MKYLSNFCRSLDLHLIKCEIDLDLSWSKNCVLSEEDGNLITVTFQINSTKVYVPVVTLLMNDNIKFLENIEQRFKRTISWNKYRSEITTQPKNNNLDYKIVPTFRNINWLFVFSLENSDIVPKGDFFVKFYIPLIEIKNLNVLIDNKPFFDQPVKNKQELCEKLVEMSKNDDHTTGNLLDYLYHQNYYKLIFIDLSKPNKYNYSSTN